MPTAVSWTHVTDFIESQKVRIDTILTKKFERRSGWPPKLAEAMRYSLFAGGKRLRPVLALTVVEMLGRDFTRFENLFVALECIHTYSLIHDDLPAMDNDDLRRGMPTSHKKFGEATAILAGDGLLTFAFELLGEESFVKNFQPENVARCVHLIAAASGPEGMVGGQYIDIAGNEAGGTEEELRRMHSMKTARLLSAAVTAPAVLAGVHEAILFKLTEYGDSIGLAFQICDDILNVVGSQDQMGKAVGSDEKMGKWTYPRILGVEGATKKAQELCVKAKAGLDPFPADRRHPLELLANFIIERIK